MFCSRTYAGLPKLPGVGTGPGIRKPSRATFSDCASAASGAARSTAPVAVRNECWLSSGAATTAAPPGSARQRSDAAAQPQRHEYAGHGGGHQHLRDGDEEGDPADGQLSADPGGNSPNCHAKDPDEERSQPAHADRVGGQADHDAAENRKHFVHTSSSGRCEAGWASESYRPCTLFLPCSNSLGNGRDGFYT